MGKLIKGAVNALKKSLKMSAKQDKDKDEDKEKQESQKRVSRIKKIFALAMQFWPLTIIIVVIVMTITVTIGASTIRNISNSSSSSQTCDTSSSSSSGGGDGSGGGDWTQSGTDANKVAKQVWDYWTAKGYSAAAVAGVVGNVQAESGFNPTTNEGGAHSMLNQDANGSMGGGLYQFTPATKFASVGDSKWSDVNAQSDYVWNSEANAFTDYPKMTDVNSAAEWFMINYERPDRSQNNGNLDRRQDAAQKAYSMWGSTNHNDGSSIAGASSTADSNNSGSDSSSSSGSDCDKSNSSNVKAGEIFDDSTGGFVLNAGLDDPNHEFVNSAYNKGQPGSHGPGAHDGWDIDPLNDPGGNNSEAIYAVADGEIAGVNTGDNGNMIFVNIKLSNGKYFQYQEFKAGSVPSNITLGAKVKAGDKIGEIGDAGSTGGAHSGKYVHIAYYDSSATLKAGSVAQWGSVSSTLSPGEFFGIKADKWVAAPQSYRWSDMSNVKKSGS